jgi:hypothetical protein
VDYSGTEGIQFGDVPEPLTPIRRARR